MARRFLIYSIGFLFGCVLVYQTMYKNTDRDFYGGWLPDGRVLKKIDQNLDRNQESYQCILTCHELFDSDIDEVLQKGDVRFAESDTKREPKLYVVDAVLESGKELKLTFEMNMESCELKTIISPDKTCNCD